jgi:methylated-DNA-[protein]-cysteine S-methyltransferase
MTYYSILKSPLGDVTLVANETELTGLYFVNHRHMPESKAGWTLNKKHPVLQKAEKELTEYFAGKRDTFTVPFNLGGTPFQKRIWKEIATIPFGKTISYSELAKKAGAPKAVRAAGAATGRNPVSVIVPCHRVMGKNNSMTGYGGGLERKQRLLALENVELPMDAPKK